MQLQHSAAAAAAAVQLQHSAAAAQCSTAQCSSSSTVQILRFRKRKRISGVLWRLHSVGPDALQSNSAPVTGASSYKQSCAASAKPNIYLSVSGDEDEKRTIKEKKRKLG